MTAADFTLPVIFFPHEHINLNSYSFRKLPSQELKNIIIRRDREESFPHLPCLNSRLGNMYSETSHLGEEGEI
jgi:hypothetical protein